MTVPHWQVLFALSIDEEDQAQSASEEHARRGRPHAGICTFDVERGIVDNIWPTAWQTDTCIGSWHYDKRILEGNRYKTPKVVIDMLCDIVSRNGNLLLNFPLPNSGMLDDAEMKTLEGITQWMAVNSEGIYGTRPWRRFGESALSAAGSSGAADSGGGQSFNESKRKGLGASDLRFMTKGGMLYAYFMGWPDGGSLKIRSLTGANVEGVELLGHGKVEFTQETDGLKVALPGMKPCEHAYGLKVMGRGIV